MPIGTVSGAWAGQYVTPWQGALHGGPEVATVAEQWGGPVSAELSVPGGPVRPGWDPSQNPVTPGDPSMESVDHYGPDPSADWGGEIYESMADYPVWGSGGTVGGLQEILPPPSGSAWQHVGGEPDGTAARSRDRGLAARRRSAPVASTNATTKYQANGITGDIEDSVTAGSVAWKYRGSYPESNGPYVNLRGEMIGEPPRSPIPFRRAGMWRPLYVRRDGAMAPRFVTPGHVGIRPTQAGYYTAKTSVSAGSGRVRWGSFWGMPAPSGQYVTPADPDMGPVYDGTAPPAAGDWQPGPEGY